MPNLALETSARAAVLGEARLLGVDPGLALRSFPVRSLACHVIRLRGGARAGEALPPTVTPEDSARADQLSAECSDLISQLPKGST